VRTRGSLAGRLIFAAALWSIAALAATGWGLSTLYRDAVIRTLDAELEVTIDTVLVGLERDGAGRLALSTAPLDPRFQRPLSGRYWAVYPLDQPELQAALRSRSLFDETVPFAPDEARALAAAPGRSVVFEARGQAGETLRIAARAVTLPGGPDPVAVLAAADRGPSDRGAGRFAITVALALAALAFGLAAAVVIQVRIGLAPLRAMGEQLAEIRAGKRARLDEEAPRELAPLGRELNALLDHNQAIMARARTHVGNLAHALKTPIAVLANEGRSAQGPLADLVVSQSDSMARQVDHYLKRAAAAARAETFGLRASMEEAALAVARTLDRLYGRRGIDIETRIEATPLFRGEREDLDEIIGNLAENACKYGRSSVRITLAADAGDGVLLVEDDGPGLTEQQRAEALKRGARLDEAAPGSGLGLAITRDIVEAYGGSLALEHSELGGLRIRVRLPAEMSA
jgi:signal transduction histidine kinase